jgi:hypothetical protein
MATPVWFGAAFWLTGFAIDVPAAGQPDARILAIGAPAAQILRIAQSVI